MSHLLERLGGFAARRCWVFILGWLIILGGLLGARQVWGGSYVNNYTVPGSNSSNGLNLLNSDYPLVRMILVPAIMTLLGAHAWWMPRWLEPVLPHLHLEGSEAAAAAPAADALAGAAPGSAGSGRRPR